LPPLKDRQIGKITQYAHIVSAHISNFALASSIGAGFTPVLSQKVFCVGHILGRANEIAHQPDEDYSYPRLEYDSMYALYQMHMRTDNRYG
ncbi:10798_t:CDS:2, partial [Paraglomus occultum]